MIRALFLAAMVSGMVASVVAGEQISLEGTFESGPADSQLMARYGSLMGYARGPSARGVKPPTATMHGAKYGQIYLRGRKQQIWFVMFGIKPNGNVDRLIIDSNADKDLTNDATLNFPNPQATAEGLLISGDRKIPYTVRLNGARLHLTGKTWVKGSLVIGAKKMLAAMVDSNHDGQFGLGDMLLLDRNGNGKLDTGYRTPAEVEYIPLSKYVFFKNAFLVPEAAADGSKLTLRPYTGPVGQIIFAETELKDAVDLRVSFWLTPSGGDGSGQAFSFTAEMKALPLSLPVDTYMRPYVSLLVPNGQSLASFRLSQLRIQKDQLYTITMAKPDIKVRVSQRGRQLNVDQSMVGTGGINYSQIASYCGHCGHTSRKNPAVTVSRASTPDKPLVSGSMQYG